MSRNMILSSPFHVPSSRARRARALLVESVESLESRTLLNGGSLLETLHPSHAAIAEVAPAAASTFAGTHTHVTAKATTTTTPVTAKTTTTTTPVTAKATTTTTPVTVQATTTPKPVTAKATTTTTPVTVQATTTPTPVTVQATTTPTPVTVQATTLPTPVAAQATTATKPVAAQAMTTTQPVAAQATTTTSSPVLNWWNSLSAPQKLSLWVYLSPLERLGLVVLTLFPPSVQTQFLKAPLIQELKVLQLLGILVVVDLASKTSSVQSGAAELASIAQQGSAPSFAQLNSVVMENYYGEQAVEAQANESSVDAEAEDELAQSIGDYGDDS